MLTLGGRYLLHEAPLLYAVAARTRLRHVATSALQTQVAQNVLPNAPPAVASQPAVTLPHTYKTFEVEQECVPEAFGYVHSTESFSAVDGPGIRFLVFLQGCAYRCIFCSNPDTWECRKGNLVSSKDVAQQFRRVLPYLRSSGGGVTVSGGEALLQPEFTAAVFQEAHKLGVSTCIDTTGQGTKRRSWDVVLPHTDMVLFCIKHIDPDRYLDITGHKMDGALKFVEELNRRQIPFWVRYVLIPSLTDDLNGLIQFTDWAKQQEYMVGVELLPYHQLGVDKWKALGLDYPLKNVQTPSPRLVNKFIQELREAGIQVLCDRKIH